MKTQVIRFRHRSLYQSHRLRDHVEREVLRLTYSENQRRMTQRDRHWSRLWLGVADQLLW